jgi:hypothetical protein
MGASRFLSLEWLDCEDGVAENEDDDYADDNRGRDQSGEGFENPLTIKPNGNEAFGFLRLRSIQIDPAKKGVTLNLIGDEKLPDRIIKTLDLSNVPLTTALRYICSATETRAHFQGRNIIILSAQ